MKVFSYRHRTLAALAAAMLLAFAQATSATGFSDVIAFGDSLSDTGNIFFVTGIAPLPPYAAGRFTSNYTNGADGLVWLDHLAAGLGAGSSPSLLGGTNYAWGGARTGPINAGFPPSLLDQLNFYLGDTGGVADPDALYVVFGGGNDIRDNDVANSATNISIIIEVLAEAGATNFLVPNLPDIGLTPESLVNGAPGGPGSVISAASDTHNQNLHDELILLEDSLGLDIIEFNLFDIFNNIISTPGDFGFSNVTEACWTGGLSGGPGTLCADPDSYLFFDGIHPTATAHELVGNLALMHVLFTTDADGDGVEDDLDNCINVSNADQTDGDADGHGNACDADFDNNCFTTFPDLSIMQAGFFTIDPELDLNSSGGPVNFADLAIMQSLFFLPPGPSASGSLCNP